VTDGVFSRDPGDPGQAIFHPAVGLDADAIRSVRDGLRRRGLRWLAKHGYLDPVAAADMGEWEHGGGWSTCWRRRAGTGVDTVACWRRTRGCGRR